MKNVIKMSALALSAIFILAGCDSDSSSDNGNENGGSSAINYEKLFLFYNNGTQGQYTHNGENGKNTDLNADATSNFYMADKEKGKLLFWADEYEEGKVDEKVVMLKDSYNYATDGNITHENFIYIGHFHDETLEAHAASEFAPENITEKMAAAMVRLNTYLAAQEALKAEINEAVVAEGEALCGYFVPAAHAEHDEHEEGHEEEGHEHEDSNATEEHAHEDHNATEEHAGEENNATMRDMHEEGHDHDEHEHEGEGKTAHYALSQTGKLYVFVEGEAGLEKVQPGIILDGASECVVGENGFTTGPEGVYVFLNSSRKMYLVDSHGADHHVHSQWSIDEFLPSSFEATQMVGFGSGEHEDHEH